MKRHLVETIKGQTEIMLHNMDTALRCCDGQRMLCGAPLWKHAYHTLHSCDRWTMNPHAPFEEPPFHRQGLNDLNAPLDGGPPLSLEALRAYLSAIRGKLRSHFDALADEDLYAAPEGCPHDRMTLILGQIRHFNVHLGNINAVTILETGRWPRVVGLEDSMGDSQYE